MNSNATAGDAEADVARLRAAIAGTCGSLDLDLGRWVLPLSGGRDSRTLLAFLVENGLRPHCVTWTTRTSLRNPLSDASIARVLARRYHVEHELLYLDETGADLETTLARFVAADEGRNDEIAGYLDGFAMWRGLALAGVQGIIRGDESFGPASRPMQPEAGRRQVGGATPDDYPAGHVLHRLALAAQTWPVRLRYEPHEDLRDYRLRLSQQGFIPIILAGLNEPKARYVEIVNPHLSRRVIGTVRSLAPESRNQARAFRGIVNGLDRVVPYARSSSTVPASDLLGRADARELVVRELMSPDIERVLPGDGALFVLAAMSAAAGEPRRARDRLRGFVKEASGALPTRLANTLAPAWKGPDPLPPAKLAFRAVLASRTIALFEEDARFLGFEERVDQGRSVDPPRRRRLRPQPPVPLEAAPGAQSQSRWLRRVRSPRRPLPGRRGRRACLPRSGAGGARRRLPTFFRRTLSVPLAPHDQPPASAPIAPVCRRHRHEQLESRWYIR